jgi:hypothetical protein
MQFQQTTIGNLPRWINFAYYQREFRSQSVDSLQQLFGQQLRQIAGCSAAAAHALVQRYGTLASFIRHLRSMDRLSAQRELESLNKRDELTETARGKIGTTLAKRILKVILDDY